MASHRDFPKCSDPEKVIKIEYDSESEDGEEEKGDLTPAAAAHSSDCTSSTAKNYAAEYHIPAEFGLCAPTADQRAHAPPPGYAAIYTQHLVHGLRLPLPEFVISVLDFYEIALTQLHPNAITILVGFMGICKRASVAPTTALFRHFFRLRKNRKYFIPVEGWYTFMAKHPKLFDSRNQQTKGWGWEKSFLFFKTEPLPEKVALSWNYSPVVDLPLSENEMPSAEEVRKLRASVQGSYKGRASVPGSSKRKPEGSNIKAIIEARIVNKLPPELEEDEMRIDLDAPIASLRKSSRAKKPIKKYEPAWIPCARNLNLRQENKSTESQSDACRQKRLKRMAESDAETPKEQTLKECVDGESSVKDVMQEKIQEMSARFAQECIGSFTLLNLKLEGENEKLKNEVASLKAEVSRLQAVADDRGPLLKAYTWKLFKTKAFAQFSVDLTEPMKSLGKHQAAELIRDMYPGIPEEAFESLEDPMAVTKLDTLFFNMIQDDGFKFPLLDHLLALPEIPSSAELKHLDVDEDEDALEPPPVPADE